MLVCIAVNIFSALFKTFSFSLAAVAAEIKIRAFLAFLRIMQRFFDEILRFLRLHDFGKTDFAKGSKSPLIEYEKITGIDPPVSLDHELNAADSSHIASFGFPSREHIYEIIDMADTRIRALFEILEPKIEDTDQKFSVSLFGQGIGAALIQAVEGVDAGDELQPFEVVFLIESVDLLDIAGVFPCHYG